MILSHAGPEFGFGQSRSSTWAEATWAGDTNVLGVSNSGAVARLQDAGAAAGPTPEP
jgi:hypothetical protein